MFSRYYKSPSPDIFAVLSLHGTKVTDPAFNSAYFDMKLALISNIPEATSFISYFDFPRFHGSISEDGYKTFISFRLPDPSKYSLEDYQKAIYGTSLKVDFGGSELAGQEIPKRLGEDLAKIEAGSIPVLIVLLVFAYGGVVATLPALLLAVWTLVLTLAALHLVALGFNVTTYVTNVATAFGIGIAIDFSIFMHLRFCEEMQRQRPAPSAELLPVVEKMLATSGRTVLFSGALLMSALLGALQFNMYYLTTMALTMVFIAFFAALGAVTVLPALYLVLGRGLFLLSVQPLLRGADSFLRGLCRPDLLPEVGPAEESGCRPAPQADLEMMQVQAYGQVQPFEDSDGAPEPFPQQDLVPSPSSEPEEFVIVDGKVQPSRADLSSWDFQGVRWVVRRPWPFLLGLGGVLVALSAVFCLQVKLASFDWAALPLDSPLRPAFESLLDDFRGSGKSDLQLFLRTPPGRAVTDESFLRALDSLCSQLEQQWFVGAVGSMVRLDANLTLPDYLSIYAAPSPSGLRYRSQVLDPFFLADLDQVARVAVALTLLPSDPRLGEAVRKVRALLKDSFSEPSVQLEQAGVAGSAARQVDTLSDLRRVLPAFLAVVVSAMFVFTLLLTGSVVLPLKTIATAGLSISASFALLMFVFQDNRGARLLQFRNNLRCLDPIQLLFVFVVAFGLSLDYEVFLLGRIQELFLRTGDAQYAIAKGVSSSARVISVASVLICCAIGGFLASGILILKMIGMGIGLTILLDATVVRCILLPATMALLGDYNWYAPPPLKRLVDLAGLRD
eukprot:CAMPEP_0170083110 /NCGR_PEP_ID=MMETSP0019_2-20121128/18516_1 /TAXON_ID=98059 /ORGANISM="Dinobryon sp., Strain UTEXLB2267" /LENGTH=786 /DNA_ID=CAMNT_0010298289 /DNA_START=245 /DNA_END=2605 /DNA_ORIENTATION=-